MSTVRPITFGPQLCARLTEGATREWLVPAGTGGYAMGTVAGLRTRRYHGLLVAAVLGSPGGAGSAQTVPQDAKHILLDAPAPAVDED